MYPNKRALLIGAFVNLGVMVLLMLYTAFSGKEINTDHFYIVGAILLWISIATQEVPKCRLW